MSFVYVGGEICERELFRNDGGIEETQKELSLRHEIIKECFVNNI
jgi:hypothetical protein